MLKIDVIKFETQDVITKSIPTPGVVPAPAPAPVPAPLSCNCGNDGCYYDDTTYIQDPNCNCPVTNWDDHTNARSYPYA